LQRSCLDKNIGKGRIYRIVHDDITPDKIPNLLNKKASELVEYLRHLNGWYRDTANKLIILKDDQSVIPELKEIALDNASIWTNLFDADKDFGIERVHALWTLEGLGIVDKDFIKAKFTDEDYQVRLTAIRLTETFLKNGATDLFSDLKILAQDGNLDVANQVALSLRYSKDKKATEILNNMSENYSENEIVLHAVK
jgi:hypothetical protein